VIERLVNTEVVHVPQPLQQWQQTKRPFRAPQSKSNKVNGES